MSIIFILTIILITYLFYKKYFYLKNVNDGIYNYHSDDNYNLVIDKIDCKKIVRIITNMKSDGTKRDAIIYNKLLQNSYICYYKNEIPSEELSKMVDVDIYIESLTDINKYKSHNKWFIVNQEILYEKLDDLKQITHFICKTKYAHKLLSSMKNKYNLKGNVYFIGHTSISNTKLNLNKDFNLFIHTAGKSPAKNTNLLIKVFKKIHKKYPETKLVITCHKYCSLFVNEKIGDNDGIIYRTFLQEEKFNEYTKKSICYICPSLVEGYGHYINEGRANSSAILTTNGPPMNEFIDNNGLLIDSYMNSPIGTTNILSHPPIVEHILYKIINYIHLLVGNKTCENSEMFFVNEKSLFDTIEKFILLSNEKKLSFCKQSYINFVDDTKKFRNRLEILINS